MINKCKNPISIILLSVIVIVTSSCISSDESKRDLSTPSKRLIGHWGVYGDGIHVPKDQIVSERWFGELNEDGIGLFSVFSDGSVVNRMDIKTSFNYAVLSESGDTVTIGSFISEEPPNPFPQELLMIIDVTKDGQLLRLEGKLGDHEFQYIDYETEP